MLFCCFLQTLQTQEFWHLGRNTTGKAGQGKLQKICRLFGRQAGYTTPRRQGYYGV